MIQNSPTAGISKMYSGKLVTVLWRFFSIIIIIHWRFHKSRYSYDKASSILLHHTRVTFSYSLTWSFHIALGHLLTIIICMLFKQCHLSLALYPYFHKLFLQCVYLHILPPYVLISHFISLFCFLIFCRNLLHCL